MFTYKDFMLEKLLNESVFQYSDKFQAILSRIKLPISKKLIDIKGVDLTTPQNYIDIVMDVDDVVTFITDAKASEIINKKELMYRVEDEEKYLTNSPKNKSVFDRLEIDINGDYFDSPEEEDIGKIIKETTGTNGKIYVLFEYIKCNNVEKIGKKVVLNKDCISPEDHINTSKLWSSNRNRVKIGRFIRSILKSNNIDFTDKEIEMFVNSYKSEIGLLNNVFARFDVVEGDLIAKFYKSSNYYSESSGTLGNSCMKHKPSYYFDIYANNPEKIKMVILYDEDGEISDGKYKSNKIVARSLLWKTDQGDMVMDRIYSYQDKDVELFKRFAEKNGWWCKKTQDSECNFTSQRGEESKKIKYTISLKEFNTEYYPYVDTFAYFDPKNGVLSNSKGLTDKDKSNYTHYLSNTDGSFSLTRYIDDEEEDEEDDN